MRRVHETLNCHALVVCRYIFLSYVCLHEEFGIAVRLAIEFEEKKLQLLIAVLEATDETQVFSVVELLQLLAKLDMVRSRVEVGVEFDRLGDEFLDQLGDVVHEPSL